VYSTGCSFSAQTELAVMYESDAGFLWTNFPAMCTKKFCLFLFVCLSLYKSMYVCLFTYNSETGGATASKFSE